MCDYVRIKPLYLIDYSIVTGFKYRCRTAGNRLAIHPPTEFKLLNESTCMSIPPHEQLIQGVSNITFLIIHCVIDGTCYQLPP